MSNPLLIISGATATGKTDLAVALAKKYQAELISTDSCQIYQGLNIGTGKDHPEGTPLHLIDLVTPDQKFSVAQFQKLALEKIKQLHLQKKLPILVGCSGFYLDSLINNNYQTFSIKPNTYWRFLSSKLSVKRLQQILKLIDQKTFLALNHADVNNHYRLTRKIEIALSFKKKLKENVNNFNILHISLSAPLPFLYQRIDKRVDKRIQLGFLGEVESLLKKYSWTDPGLKIAAYQLLKPYFDNPSQVTLDSCLVKWKFAEHSDARRQSTYLKSRYRNSAHFIDITQDNYQDKIFKIVTKWYNQL